MARIGYKALRHSLVGLGLLVGTWAVPCRAATLQILDADLELDGGEQSVSFAVDDATGIEGFELTIAYDPNVVRISGPLRPTAVTQGCLFVDNSTEAGTLRIALACMTPLQGHGPLLVVPVEARAAGVSPFEIVYCRVNEQLSNPQPIGVVTVHGRAAATLASAQ